MEINLDSEVKCDYDQDGFQETCARSTTVSKELLYQISRKHEKPVLSIFLGPRQRGKQTDVIST